MRAIATAILVLALSGCGSVHKSHEQTEDDVREAVFRFALSQWKPNDGRVCFLKIAENDPSEVFMKRLRRDGFTVRKRSVAQPILEGLRDPADNRRGFEFNIRKLEWIDDSTVKVRCSMWSGPVNETGSDYVLVKEGRHWNVKEAKLMWNT